MTEAGPNEAPLLLQILSIGFSICVFVLSWIMICATRTSRDQHRVVDAAFATYSMAVQYKNTIWADKFDAHMWRLVTLRDPWTLYPPALAEAAKRGEGKKPYWQNPSYDWADAPEDVREAMRQTEIDMRDIP